MNNKDDNSRTRRTSSDEFINDYLNDIFGNDLGTVLSEETGQSVAMSLTQEVAETQSISSFFAEEDKDKEERLASAKSVSVVDEKLPSRSLYADIENGYFLIPTIKVHYLGGNQPIRSQVESIVILLTNLYYLRRPLSPRVRQCFLDFSEQVIDDYQASKWIKHTPLGSVLSEV